MCAASTIPELDALCQENYVVQYSNSGRKRVFQEEEEELVP